MNDLISRQAAIDKLKREEKIFYSPNGLRYLIGAIRDLPSAQPEQPSEIQDILDYLDTALHPIISPEHWNVYSELHDMISTLPSAQPDRKKGKWIPHSETCREYIGTVLVRVDYDYWFCDACGYRVKNGQPMYKFCPNCGADMRGEQNG